MANKISNFTQGISSFLYDIFNIAVSIYKV